MIKRGLIILALALVSGLAVNAFFPWGLGWLPPEVADPLWKPVDPAGAAGLKEKGALLVDARDPGQYKLAHARGAVSLYPEEWELIYPLLKPVLEQAPEIVVYGRSISRWPAAAVAQRLAQLGHAKVLVMEGSLEDWEAAGQPVARPRRRNS